MSIESMQSTYSAYQQAGGMEKYLEQDSGKEQKERIRQLLFAWCNEVNQYYSITIPKNEPLFQSLAAPYGDFTACAFILGKTAPEIENPHRDDLIEACILAKEIAVKIFSKLECLGSLLLKEEIAHSQIAQFLDKKHYSHALSLFVQILGIKQKLEKIRESQNISAVYLKTLASTDIVSFDLFEMTLYRYTI